LHRLPESISPSNISFLVTPTNGLRMCIQREDGTTLVNFESETFETTLCHDNVQ